MTVRPNEEAEFRQQYAELLKNISDRARGFLKAKEAQSSSRPSKKDLGTRAEGSRPTKTKPDLTIRVDGQEVYRQDLATGETKANKFSPLVAEKIQTAIDRPEQLKGAVSINYGGRQLFRNREGQVKKDLLKLARVSQQVSPQQGPELSVEERLERLERNLSTVGKPGESVEQKLDRIDRKLDALLSRPIASRDLDNLVRGARSRVQSAWRQVRQIVRRTVARALQVPNNIRQAHQERRAQSGIDYIQQTVRQQGKLQPDGSHVLEGKNFKYVVAENGDIALRARGNERKTPVAEYRQDQDPAAQAKAVRTFDRLAARAQQGAQQIAQRPRRGQRQ